MADKIKWEYRVLAIQGDISGAMDEASKDDWEPVCYLGLQPDDNGVNAMMFLARKPRSPIIKPTDQEKKLVLLK